MDQFYTLLQTNVTVSADILCTYIVATYALLMFSKSLRMIKIDRNMLERKIVCKKYNFKISASAGFIV